ncbi:MAG: hypothetical protein H6Q04_2990 [Acidobacteria bacterium]|nr:hypothetical protein [Acidobacteriota bacterium]
MKTTFAVTLSVLLLLFSACAQKVNDPADVQAIKKVIDDFAKAANAQDAAGVAAVMTDKVYEAESNAPVAIGKEAVQSGWQKFYDNFNSDLSVLTEDVRVSGDLAVARGTWRNNAMPKAQGLEPNDGRGSWITAFVRQNDGSWKWDWCVANSSQPLRGNTASGADEEALYQLERDWAAANLKKDTDVVEKFLADDFVSNSNGRTQNKKQLLAEMKNNAAKIESVENSDMKAMVFGDTAVVHGRYIEKSTTNGKDSSVQGRYTEVYVKRDGRWQCVTQYATSVQ